MSGVRKPTAWLRILPYLGLALLIPPTYLIARWILIFNSGGGHDTSFSEFSSALPHALRDPVSITLFALVCAATAAAVGAVGLIWHAGARRLLCGAIFAGGWLLSLWFIWSLL